MRPKVQNTAHNVGKPAIITTFIPWIGLIPVIPVCNRSEWNTNNPSATNTTAKGTPIYMSPELVKIRNGSGTGEFNPELSDIFSLGISFLRISLNL